MPCVLNAANEIAVAAFLQDEVGFLEMSDLVEFTMNSVDFKEKPTLEDYFDLDKEARRVASSFMIKQS